jgi:glycosyltransferase involved in cell wall biosynthesis
MRVMVSALHRYPASVGGPGGGRVFDNIVKGLAEIGHEVFYWTKGGASLSPPDGVISVEGPVWDVDILHFRRDDDVAREVIARGLAHVVTCQTDIQFWGLDRSEATDHWIFVSRNLAQSYGKQRFVYPGIDPEEYLYSATKDEYFLFVGALRLALQKGLDIALALASKMGFHLIVAGSSPDRACVAQVRDLCRRHGAEYVGEVYGTKKAVLFAGARALLFPTKLNEAFGLVMAEALVSGTPVICSGNGACREVVTPEVGFVCATADEYAAAIANVATIDPVACRKRALDCFHYRITAAQYVHEYRVELSRK